MQEFHGWLADQRDVVKECSDQSGDISVLERKLQKLKVQIHHLSTTMTELSVQIQAIQLHSCRATISDDLVDHGTGSNECISSPLYQGALDRVEEGESRLTRVCEEGEKLLLHLPKASAGQVQTRLSSAQQDWDSYVQQCRQNQLSLERSTTELNR